MTPQQVLQDVYNQYEEHLEMMSTDEKFILITNTLSQKLAFEIAMKDHYKSCFEKSINVNNRINS